MQASACAATNSSARVTPASETVRQARLTRGLDSNKDRNRERTAPRDTHRAQKKLSPKFAPNSPPARPPRRAMRTRVDNKALQTTPRESPSFIRPRARSPFARIIRRGSLQVFTARRRAAHFNVHFSSPLADLIHNKTSMTLTKSLLALALATTGSSLNFCSRRENRRDQCECQDLPKAIADTGVTLTATTEWDVEPEQIITYPCSKGYLANGAANYNLEEDIQHFVNEELNDQLTAAGFDSKK